MEKHARGRKNSKKGLDYLIPLLGMSVATKAGLSFCSDCLGSGERIGGRMWCCLTQQKTGVLLLENGISLV